MTSSRAFNLIIFVAMTLVMGSLPAHAQNNRKGASYKQPLPLKLEGEIRKHFPDYFADPAREMLLMEGFFPIGWSADGKFAYYLEPADEACGCYFAKLVILDLKTDKILWSYDYDSSENPEKLPQTIAALWKDKQKMFSEKLSEYDIKQQGRADLLFFPIKHEGDQLTAELSLKEKKDVEANMTGVGHAALLLSSQKNGKKTVFEKDYPEIKEGPMPLDIKVMGYVKSPFEQRIALVLIEVYNGYEGFPHITSVQINGASLVTGFK